MPKFSEARTAIVSRILEGSGKASPDQRRAAFDDRQAAAAPLTLIEKIRREPRTVTDDDVSSARKSGLDEDQIFELVVCAAVGQAVRQYDSALAALQAASAKE